MISQIQIIQMSSMTKQEVLVQIIKLLSENQFQMFKVLLKKKINKEIQPQKAQSEQEKFKIIVKQQDRFKSQKFANLSRPNTFDRSINITMLQSETFIEEFPSNQSKRQMALYHYQLGSYETSLQLFKQIQSDLNSKTLNIQQKKRERQQIQTFIGNCYFKLQNYSSAIKHYTSYLLPSGEFPSKMYGQKMNNLGSCYAMLGQDKASMKAYSQALKIYSSQEQVDCSNLLNNIASIYFRFCMYGTAAQYFKESIQERKCKSPHLKQSLYYSYHKLALCLEYEENYKDAEIYLDFSLELADQGFGDVGEILKCMASLQQKQSKWTQSLAYYEKLRELYERNGVNQAQIYEKVANVYKKMGMDQQFCKFMKMAYGLYQKEDNKRKISELSTAYNYSIMKTDKNILKL